MSRFALDDARSGPPALLLHGFPATRGLWKDVAPRLAAAGFRTLAPDLIGYGASPDDPDVGMERQARWLLELLDELRIEQATVVAHDVGTAAAQILTVHAPDRVRRLILMDGVFETEWAMAALESIRDWDPAQAARLQPVLARKLRSIRDLLGAYAGETGGRRLIHAARCLDPRQTEGMTGRLRQTGVPIHLVWGADDAYLPVDTVGRPLAAALGVELHLLSGGHFLPLDNPEALARKLIELIQTNAAP
jgi:pimeloyl-ACP methyl ester carboxylesterase